MPVLIRNADIRRDTRTRYSGVSQDLRTGKYKARCSCGRATYYLGVYETAEEAALAYNTALTFLERYGACHNFIDGPVSFESRRDIVFRVRAIILGAE